MCTSSSFTTVVSVLLLLVCLPIASSSHSPSHCRQQPRLCRSIGSHPASQLYNLETTLYKESLIYRRRSDVVMTIYGKNMPNLETVGPSWYRLEPIPPTKGLGSFFGLLEKSGAIIKDDGIEFTSTDEPLAILDLPRTYTWLSHKKLRVKSCFKLTIQHGDFCEQLITPNCSDINTTNTSTSTPPVTTAPFNQSTTTSNQSTTTSNQSTTTTIQSTTTTTPSPTTAPIATVKTVEDCQKHNCTGKKLNPTCGSDGNVYPHVCHLRLHKCLYGLKKLQRDKSWISCNTTTPSVPTTPTIPLNQTCLRNKLIHGTFYKNVKCDCRGLHKPVQCFKSDDGTIRCVCMNPILGDSWDNWEINSTNYSTIVRQRKCNL